MSRSVWLKRRTDDRFVVKMTNVSDKNLEDRVLMGDLGDNLAKGGTNVKKVLDVEVIFVTTTHESTANMGCFQFKVVDTDVFN